MRARVRLDPDLAASILRSLPPATKKRIRDALRALAEDLTGINHRLDIRELDRDEREPRVYRLRVGDWRIVFLRRPSQVQVIRIFHRRQGYGWMERLDEEE